MFIRYCKSPTGTNFKQSNFNGCPKWISKNVLVLTAPHFLRSRVPDPVPREIEGKPFSNPPTDPLHPHTVQSRTKTGGHDAMSMHPQARSQTERPDPSGASRTGGAPLRRFTGTSLPNSKVGGSVKLLKIKPVCNKIVFIDTSIDCFCLMYLTSQPILYAAISDVKKAVNIINCWNNKYMKSYI